MELYQFGFMLTSFDTHTKEKHTVNESTRFFAKDVVSAEVHAESYALLRLGQYWNPSLLSLEWAGGGTSILNAVISTQTVPTLVFSGLLVRESADQPSQAQGSEGEDDGGNLKKASGVPTV